MFKFNNLKNVLWCNHQVKNINITFLTPWINVHTYSLLFSKKIYFAGKKIIFEI